MPASGPVNEPKMFPARIMEDQDMEMQPVQLGTPPFSSPDPLTDGIRMLPLEDGTSAVEGEVLPEQPAVTPEGEVDLSALQREVEDGLSGMAVADLKSLAEEKEVEVIRADGLSGNPRKEDYIAAVTATEVQSATSFARRISEAKTTDELDEVEQDYNDEGVNLETINNAIESKRSQLEEQEKPAEEPTGEPTEENPPPQTFQ